MSRDFREIYKVGQNVVFVNDDFDAVKKNIQCVVKEVQENKMTILDIETNTKLYIEAGFNDDCVISDNSLQSFISAIDSMLGS